MLAAMRPVGLCARGRARPDASRVRPVGLCARGRARGRAPGCAPRALGGPCRRPGPACARMLAASASDCRLRGPDCSRMCSARRATARWALAPGAARDWPLAERRPSWRRPTHPPSPAGLPTVDSLRRAAQPALFLSPSFLPSSLPSSARAAHQNCDVATSPSLPCRASASAFPPSPARLPPAASIAGARRRSPGPGALRRIRQRSGPRCRRARAPPGPPKRTCRPTTSSI